MSVYAGIDVHRKRSQVAVINEGGEVLATRNVPNGAKPILSVTGDLPVGTLARPPPAPSGGEDGEQVERELAGVPIGRAGERTWDAGTGLDGEGTYGTTPLGNGLQ